MSSIWPTVSQTDIYIHLHTALSLKTQVQQAHNSASYSTQSGASCNYAWQKM